MKIKMLLCLLYLTTSHVFAEVKFTNNDLQSKIEALKAKTDKIVIFRNRGTNPKKVTLKGKDIKVFFALLKLKMPAKPYVCRCSGQLAIFLYSKDKQLARMSYHHGKSFRGLDIPINTNIDILPAYQKKFLDYFTKHGFKLQ